MTNAELDKRVTDLEDSNKGLFSNYWTSAVAEIHAAAAANVAAKQANEAIEVTEKLNSANFELARIREINRDAIYNEHLHQWAKHVANVEQHFALQDRINATTAMIHGAGVAALVFIAFWLVLHG